MTILYYTIIDGPISSKLFVSLCEALPDMLRKKINRYKRWQDAYASLYGKLLISKLIEKFNLHAKLENLKFNDFNKPFFDIENFNFNISHSGKYVLCIGSNDCKVGIDIEEIKMIDLENFRGQFSLDEWVLISSSPLDCFYSLWTKKESIVKALGYGLNYPISTINLVNTEEQIMIDGVAWKVTEIYFDSCYKCAVTTSADGVDIHVIEVKHFNDFILQ